MDEKERAYIDMMWQYAKDSGRDFSCDISADGNISVSITRPTENESTYRQRIVEEGKR